MPTIQIYEHTSLTYEISYDQKNKAEKIKFDSLKYKKKIDRYYKREIEGKEIEDSARFFHLKTDGISFKQFVGVLKVGDLTIEVLPKIDGKGEDGKEEKAKCQSLLYEMFKMAGNIDGKVSGFSSLNYFNNNFLDLYISYFLKEVEYLLHTGLVKKYNKKEGNLNSLKGRLNFSKQISKNLVHKEKFAVTYTNYDSDNVFNQILLKALRKAKRINTSPDLFSRIENLIISFPEVKNIECYPSTFKKIVFDRKTKDYKNAIDLAKFILLYLHPDLKTGESDTLAIMFDMNKLYEAYVAKVLKQKLSSYGYKVSTQQKINFWKYKDATSWRKVKPDIIIQKEGKTKLILDTKWKLPKAKYFPVIEDLRQMYAYNHLYFEQNEVKLSALVYPSKLRKNRELGGDVNLGKKVKNIEFCDVIYLFVNQDPKSQKYYLDISSLVDFVIDPPVR